MELLVTLVSVQLLWVELERMALFVSLRNERLNEREALSASDSDTAVLFLTSAILSVSLIFSFPSYKSNRTGSFRYTRC